jgi:hypothetical protein
MATNTIQIKRTSVSGRAANSSTLTNPGELALNMTDGIMYSTNGSVVFEIGANTNNSRVRGTLTVNAISANGGVGTAGQLLASDGTKVYWITPTTGVNAQQNTYTYTLAANATVITGADNNSAVLNYTTGLESVFINGVRQISGVDYNTTNATAITLVDTALTGEVVQVVTWAGAVNSTNVNAQFAWTNTHSFSNTVTFNGSVNATSTGAFASTLQVGNNSGGVDATLHIKSIQGGNGRFLQFSPQANSANALAIMASSNTSGGEQWWSFGSQNDDTFKIQKGVGFGGAGVSISNTGAITSADRADAFGYKGLPQNQQTSAYTLVMSDIGKHIYATAANFNITIPANSTTAFPIGAAMTIVVEDQFHTLVPAAGVTLVLAGTGAATTGTRTLAQGAVATILKVGTDRWYVSGAGVT